MKQLKFLTILFLLLLLTTTAFALQYNYFLDNGKWSQYTSDLNSAYYENDNYFSTYDRSFENLPVQDFKNACLGEWCSTYNVRNGIPVDPTIIASSDFATQGSKSLKIYTSNNASANNTFLLYSKEEILGDANISFDYRIFNSSAYLRFGYVNDANTFVQLYDLGEISGDTGWTNYSYTIPSGTYRLALQVVVIGSRAPNVYFDNIRVTKNNVGTFRTTNPAFCGSINSCSNIEEHLKSNELGGTYWVVDYVAGATCSWSKNGSLQGSMIEGTNGMYYANINHSVTSGAYEDINLSATCLRVPFVQKYFFATPRLFRYGFLNGGNFEEEPTGDLSNTCSSNWCYSSIQGNRISTRTIKSSTHQKFDGQYSLESFISNTSGGNGTNTIWSKEDYSAGDTIHFNFKTSGLVASLKFGYVNDSNTFTAIEELLNYTNADWNTSSVIIPAGNHRFAFQTTSIGSQTAYLYVDAITSSGKKQASTLTATNNLTSNFGLKGTTYTFSSSYKNTSGFAITDGDCNIKIAGTDYTASYNSGTGNYEYSTAFVSDGTYAIVHSCESESFDAQTTSYSITISTPASQIITFTPIANIDTYVVSDFAPVISINPINSIDDIVFSIINQESASEILFEWYNLVRNSTQQYSVYTSTDGETWVVDDTINFGSSATYDDPIQKLPRANQHYYSFEDTLPHAEKVYYKIVYNQLPLAWQTIANSTDWVNINQPLVYTDANNYKWDLYADSNYSSIYSYTSKRFPELITSDFETGFELQFTAFSSSATTLQVGYVIGTTKSVVNVPITTTPKRYSVPIDPTSNEARLLITSDGNNSEVYLTDYAIVPRAYFAGRLNVYNRDGSTLNAIINEGVSKTYLREGVPFIFETSAYDRDGDLQRLNVQALIGGITIKSQDFYLKDATKKDKVFTWYETIDGFVDLNGNYINPVGMRDIQIQATLYNNANESVSVQTSTYKILQYPYFQNDLVFNLFSVNAKVGESPKVRFSLQQQDPSQFVGFRVFIYDGEHSIADPNYETTILNDVLKCTSFSCAKELEFTEYVYDANQNYRIAFLVLLKTENESYTNPLTLKVYNQLVTYRNFETARILQVFERTDRTYRNDEKIQLVLQLRDEPYKNILDDTAVYLTADICSTDVAGSGCSVFGTTRFYPKSKIYDETTGYNYFFFDQLFYDDSGNLFPDGNYIRFQAHITDQRYAHRIADIPTATLGDKCATGYGTLFNYSIFTMNFWKNLWTSSERALFGCTTYSSEVISLHDAEEKRILIDADHNVGSGQNHSIACLKVDNENFQNTLEQDLVCAVFWNRNEQSVDKFVFTLGNENSDYAKSGAEQQYMKFEVPAELIIFNDAFMLQQSLNAEYQTDTIDTLGEVVFYGFDKLFSGIANPLTAIPEGLTRTGLITNVGFDINFSNAFDPTYVKGLYFFKIQGLKVINQYDYINQYPDLERLNPKYFTKFAIDNKIKLPVEDTIVRIYTNDLASFQPVGEQLDALSVRSPLIIFAERSKQQGADGNFIQSITTLRFNLISDMLSNNQTQTQRNFIPFVFSYVVPAKTGFFEIIDDILYGTDGAGKPAGLLTNPINFGFKNWFWFVIILVFLLIASLILKNMRSNGGQITIPVITPFLENMHTNKVYKRGR